MLRRWTATLVIFLACSSAAGCEITASALVQQEYNTDPRVFSKPDGVARAEIKITRVIGKDVKK